MTNNDYVTMLVCWKQQRRLINFKIDDDLNTIEKSIINNYQLQQTNYFYQYQIQYYDKNYQTFIDLCPSTIQHFQQLLQELLLPNAPSKNENIWRLRIILKSIEIIRDTSRDSTTVRIYDYPKYEPVSTPMDDTMSCSYSVTNTEDMHKAATSQIENDDHQITNQIIKFNSDNPLNFHFEDDIANRQRKQYESEIMRRKKNSTSLLIGGVFLRGSNLDGTIGYPTLQFQIPKDKYNLSWDLYLYILTECDTNGNYYLHASKGLYDGTTRPEDRFGLIPNSDLVNPYKIQLSETDIQQGKYEIRLRACNIRNLPIHKHDKLRKFPELNYFMIYDDDALISEYTTTNLNFNSEKYHLGCTLVCDYRVQARCISKSAIDDMKRKRK